MSSQCLWVRNLGAIYLDGRFWLGDLNQGLDGTAVSFEG